MLPVRQAVLLVLISLMFLAVFLRILSLQVLGVGGARDFLREQGDLRSLRNVSIPAYRGMITDRHGEPLAVSTPVVDLAVDPRRLEEPEHVQQLAAALGESADELGQRLAAYREAGRHFMYLRRHMVPADAQRVTALKLPGIDERREYQRFYPAGEVAAQLVGMTNVDGRGISGLEKAYDADLSGRAGVKQYVLDLRRSAVRSLGVQRPAEPGQDLRLSLDLRLQYLQQEELLRAVAMTGAASGSITTLDSQTGEVLAIASYPSYNPNDRSEIKPGADRNRALVDAYEPGSTMKPLTLVAALESGRYTPETVIDTSPGRIRVGRKVLPDPRNYGEISLSRVIEKSSQVGITRVSLDLGHEPVWEVMRRFGLGQPPGTGFPGESTGLLPHRERWRPIEQVTLAFGYGLTATPVQLARAYSVFANGGLLPQVSLLARDAQADAGQVMAQRVISAELAAQVRGVLHAVTGEHGTATRARVEGYEVGGKTGTVHKVGEGGYIDDQYVAWFVGMAPVDDPRFVTVVLLDRPKGDNYGGSTAAAPVFARVARGTLHLLGVPPQTPLPAEDAGDAAAQHPAVALLQRGTERG